MSYLLLFYIIVNQFIRKGKTTSEIDLPEFCCLNADCPDYGLKDQGNIVLKKGSIRGVTRATEHDKDTICKWFKLAGAHS
ncbi:hypothetical protein [Methanolobus psychrotolerans]|uniref:hypothetical protein n=1 Tax=Methanolobus psychrotolerans TaxID=1874706 RepID=UPI00101AE1D3|nr:hypothetical protein [Methanolobus psychrotolerans]